MKDFVKNQIKQKNEDIENWVTKYFELEKALNQAVTKLKSFNGQKKLKSNDPVQLSQGRRRKVRLDHNSIKEIQTSMEQDLNICESSDEIVESSQTQTIPAYQLPKNSSIKKDDYDCLENVQVKKNLLIRNLFGIFF